MEARCRICRDLDLMGVDQTRSFQESGFAGPFNLIDTPDVNALTKALSRAKSRMFFWHRMLSRMPLIDKWFPLSRWGTAKWEKGIHAVSGEAFHLGADHRIVERVSQLLGPDLLLSGSMVINQRPGDFHSWHVDVEQGEWKGVTVWVALANVTTKSTLRVVAGSHRIGMSPPAGPTTALDDEAVLAEARRHEADCQILSLVAEPGQFYILAGDLWHSTWNESSKIRYAVIFQYCRPDVQVRWPVRERLHNTELPIKAAYKIPCFLVSGEDRHQKNLLAAPPL